MGVWMFFWIAGWIVLLAGGTTIFILFVMVVAGTHPPLPESGIPINWRGYLYIALANLTDKKIFGKKLEFLFIVKVLCLICLTGVILIGCGWDLYLVK